MRCNNIDEPEMPGDVLALIACGTTINNVSVFTIHDNDGAGAQCRWAGILNVCNPTVIQRHVVEQWHTTRDLVGPQNLQHCMTKRVLKRIESCNFFRPFARNHRQRSFCINRTVSRGAASD